ncbi:MAG TPA: Type 1 glutamine amidotransferase-like domain-containing protein [Candidatus Fimousia stercorigallinarum]|nr:Type 1 glutamine amidotransferase-like domain-containing protein [Candidatus Fimousia stercorigallinarum]
MNILLNINNFSEPFAYEILKDIIKPYMRVLIVPFSYHEDYIHNAEEFDEHYSKGKEEFEDIAKEFMNYGIKRRNIQILHYYRDTRKTTHRKFHFADILFFIGGYPDRLMYRIDHLKLRPLIKKFKGIIMGTSAGAMVQLDCYHQTPEEEGQEYDYGEGLGLLSGFDIEVHYEPSFLQLTSMITDLKYRGRPIYALPNKGGMIVDGEKIVLLGDAFRIGPEDIDDIQATIDWVVREGKVSKFERIF